MKKVISFLSALAIFASLISLSACSHEHEFGEWSASDAKSCDTAGTRSRSCSCGEVQFEVVAAGHNPSDWIVIKKPTCTVPGERSKGCTRCGEILENESISPLGHSVASYDKYNNDATSQKNGTVSGFCSACKRTVSKPLEGSAALMKDAFSDKKISILGDSISTYLNVSNGDAADTTNSTIRDGVLYYDEQKIRDLGVTLDKTWWQRTTNLLGASVLVNNSWSGSFVKDTSSNTRPTAGAYLERAVNLHDNTGDNAGEEPDIIFVYMGTNDYYKYKSSVGSVNYSTIESKLGADYIPSSFAEAYAIMLHKITKEYENAEVYCLNVLEGPSTTEELEIFNRVIENAANHYGAIYVDICKDSGIKYNSAYENYIPADDGDGTKNTLHPNAEGMALISDCLFREVIKNSKYLPDFSSLIKD